MPVPFGTTGRHALLPLRTKPGKPAKQYAVDNPLDLPDCEVQTSVARLRSQMRALFAAK